MAENRAARLLAALAHAGLGDLSGSAESDIQEALDAFLLAAARSGVGRTGDLPTDPPQADEALAEASLEPEPAADDSCDDPSVPEPGPQASAPGTASVWLKDDSSSHSIPGRPLSFGRVPALPNALDIARALRPLRRFRPSRVHRRLDLGATVDHYTRTGVLVPQLAPAAEPWLEAVVVVDRGTSMAVWDETSRALTKVLRTLSAFRSVHVWHLEHPPEAAPVLRNHHGRPLPIDPSDPRHIQPAHRLLLVVSDCAAPAWRQNDLWQTLHTWGLTAPVALINPLPKRLWQRSGLDLPRTTATASVPASPGRLLAYRRPRLFRDDAPGTQPWQALPVLQMDAHQILAWARAMMRTDPSGCEAVLVPASGRVPSRSRSPRSSAASPGAPATDTQVTAAAEAFTDNLRSPAVRLAIAASSLDMFTLPVLDVIRERIVPEAALADTAEFLTAGLLTAARHEDTDIVYRFHPAAANHLRGLLSRDQAWDAHFALTDHLAAHPQAPHGIVAALHSPTSQERLPTGLRPVAQAAAATARLLGIETTGPRSGVDEQVGPAPESSHEEKGEVQQIPAPAVPDDLQESEPVVAVAPDGPQIDAEVILHVHQRDMLDRLKAEREIHGRHRNLLVAPPGTGKTVMAAFDYKRLCEQHHRDLCLLFIGDSVAAVQGAHRIYRDALMTPTFGEPLYGGEFPEGWNHVFATVQSLGRIEDELPPHHFDVIVIDEFHGVGLSACANVLERFAPMELLGLSSDPGRTDGPSIHDAFFDGRIAAEMRLQEALVSGLLTPLHYVGIADGTDLQTLGWKRGWYDRASLNNLLTADDARARLVIRAVGDTVPEVRAMRAVGFCESVAHAEFMTRCFRDAGFHAATLTARDRPQTRQETLSSLRSGDLQAIFCVDTLSESVHIPEVDTLLLLRPPSSTLRFLRQLGVGLPRFPGKPVLTVLDFIGRHRKEVRLDYQFRAMTNLTGRQLLDHLEHGAPRLDDGCMITLDETAKILVTASLREQMLGSVTDAADGSRRVGEGQQPFAERPAEPVADPPTDTEPASGPPATDRLRAFDQSPRVVMVRGAHGTDTSTEAGITLTPRLVLTCAHMSDEARLRIVRTDGTEIACRTVWKRPGALDAALVLTDENILDSEDWERLLPSRLNWGRMPEGLTSPVRVTGIGRSGKRTELRGQARPTDVRLTIEGTEPFTAGVLTGSSGALVSYDGFFVGMVTRRHLQLPQLMAVPAAFLLQDPGFRRTLATHMTTPYELEDIGSEPPADSWKGPSAVCIAVEAHIVSGRRGTGTPHLELELAHDIRDSLTAIMRRASIDGVVAEEAVADARADLLVILDGPTAVQDMGRVLVELQTAVAAHHDVTLGVGASIGEVTDTHLGLVGGAVSQAVRLASNTYFREQLHQAARFADPRVCFAVSNTLRALTAGKLDPGLQDRFVPLEPSTQPDPEAGWLYEGSTEELGRALAAGSGKSTLPTASSDRNRLDTKRRALADAEKKVSEFRTKVADRRAKATRERSAAARTTSASIQSARLRSAQRHDAEANRAAHEASIWSAKAAKYGREAADLTTKLAEAEQAERRATAGQARTESRLSTTEAAVEPEPLTLQLNDPEGWVPILNPYAASMPVDDENMFIGRDVLIRQLTGSLQRGEHVVLHGQRRAGKSSVLHQLQRRLPPGLLAAKFSLLELAPDLTHAGLLYKIAVAFFNRLEDLEDEGLPGLGIPRPVFADYRDSNSPQARFESYMRGILRRMRADEVYRNLRLALLLDEFTMLYAAIEHGPLPGDFMDSWRAMMEGGLFGSVVVGDERMTRFLKAFPDAFRSARQQRLSYLDERSAEKLITEPIAFGDGASRYRGDAVARILHLTGGSPYYIQMLCRVLVDRVNARRQPLIGPADVDEVAALLIEGHKSLGPEHFDNLLHAGDAAVGGLPAVVVQQVLTAGLAGGPGNLHLDGYMARQLPMGSRVIDALLHQEVIVRTAGDHYQVIVGLFAEWLWRHR
ncbi:SAV_2336 family protein [Streptomyces sp. NBC_00390]|uniref:SAV_2336 N-terminal domain-related protein n=1 Tax=Streptomyces sp. NBC_00390 TaxID=2975736 RepID=UPI002E1FCDC4